MNVKWFTAGQAMDARARGAPTPMLTYAFLPVVSRGCWPLLDHVFTQNRCILGDFSRP